MNKKLKIISRPQPNINKSKKGTASLCFLLRLFRYCWCSILTQIWSAMVSLMGFHTLMPCRVGRRLLLVIIRMWCSWLLVGLSILFKRLTQIWGVVIWNRMQAKVLEWSVVISLHQGVILRALRITRAHQTKGSSNSWIANCLYNNSILYVYLEFFQRPNGIPDSTILIIKSNLSHLPQKNRFFLKTTLENERKIVNLRLSQRREVCLHYRVRDSGEIYMEPGGKRCVVLQGFFGRGPTAWEIEIMDRREVLYCEGILEEGLMVGERRIWFLS